jgi:hypothetical protein
VCHEGERAGGHQRHRRECLHGAVGQAHRCLVGGLAVKGKHPGGAVRGGARRFLRAGSAGRARMVLDHHGAAQDRLQLGLKNARDDVRAAAGWPRNNQAQGTVRPSAWGADEVRRRKSRRGGRDHEVATLDRHARFLLHVAPTPQLLHVPPAPSSPPGNPHTTAPLSADHVACVGRDRERQRRYQRRRRLAGPGRSSSAQARSMASSSIRRGLRAKPKTKSALTAPRRCS